MIVFFLHVHIITRIFIIEIVCVLLDLKKFKLAYRGFVGDVVNRRGSWFLMKGAPPGL